MKKIFMLFLLCLFVVKGVAQSPGIPGIRIHFSVALTGVGGGVFDPIKGNDPVGRAPVAAPNVCIDGSTLYLNNVSYDLALQLVDEDGEVAYATYVPAGTATIALPGDLSGDYELRLVYGNWLFAGWVSL